MSGWVVYRDYPPYRVMLTKTSQWRVVPQSQPWFKNVHDIPDALFSTETEARKFLNLAHMPSNPNHEPQYDQQQIQHRVDKNMTSTELWTAAEYDALQLIGTQKEHADDCLRRMYTENPIKYATVRKIMADLRASAGEAKTTIGADTARGQDISVTLQGEQNKDGNVTYARVAPATSGGPSDEANKKMEELKEAIEALPGDKQLENQMQVAERVNTRVKAAVRLFLNGLHRELKDEEGLSQLDLDFSTRFDDKFSMKLTAVFPDVPPVAETIKPTLDAAQPGVRTLQDELHNSVTAAVTRFLTRIWHWKE